MCQISCSSWADENQPLRFSNFEYVNLDLNKSKSQPGLECMLLNLVTLVLNNSALRNFEHLKDRTYLKQNRSKVLFVYAR
jgi:hypothetical protein